MNHNLTPNEVKRVLEAAILSSASPMPLPDLRRLFDDDIGTDTIRRLLEEIRVDWTDRGVELAQLSTGWRFQTRPTLQPYLERLSDEKAPKYSRAVMETLAIIAYRQPVSRGDVEDIRGVVVSPNIIRTLEERGWIDVVGHRETPGRPALYATTKAFLDDLGLRSLQELPPLEEIARSVEAGPDLVAAATALPAANGAEHDEHAEHNAAAEDIETTAAGTTDDEASAGGLDAVAGHPLAAVEPAVDLEPESALAPTVESAVEPAPGPGHGTDGPGGEAPPGLTGEPEPPAAAAPTGEAREPATQTAPFERKRRSR